jgi:hypothetical protein
MSAASITAELAFEFHIRFIDESLNSVLIPEK